MTLLGVDVGTTGLKMGVFRPREGDLELLAQYACSYEIRTYHNGLFSDIDPRRWQEAFEEGCRHLTGALEDVEVMALSGTTPALTAMDREGNPLYPAILMLDQRSRRQAQQIIETMGLERLMELTGNVPVAGGCSLASILWLRQNHPEIYDKVHVFGHSNTFMAKWLCGAFAIDPSSASLTALYNTSCNDLSWNREIAETFGLEIGRLPPVILSRQSAGRLRNCLAARWGMRREPHVVIGGNDAVLAAYSVGIQEPGQIINVNGTCEITLVCLPRCIPSPQYNVRAHVIPDRWLTLYVMNAGGAALEWFRKLFCRQMNAEAFYGDFLPSALDTWVPRDTDITYVPYLLGSRYSQEPLKAEFRGLTAETDRDELLAALIKGLCRYQREHLKEISLQVPLKDPVYVTGGAVNPAVIRAKRKWLREGTYLHRPESSMKGAALLARQFLGQGA